MTGQKPVTAKAVVSHGLLKPFVAGALSAVGEYYILKNQNIQSCAYFGASVGAGIASMSWAEPFISRLAPTNTPVGSMGKFLEGRVAEALFGSLGAYTLNHYVFKNQYSHNQMLQKLAVIVGADVAAETVTEMIIHMRIA